ncbi:MAG TPA: hypothetical protein VN708_11240 [Terriglobales bacterium]|jgi:hypothetical protein|nr:hypothetical protein [Terriglobales bacterium]
MTSVLAAQAAAFKKFCMRSGNYDGSRRNYFFPRMKQRTGNRATARGAHGCVYVLEICSCRKAAMHVIRLLNEGIELMRSDTITLPRPEKDLLITIRTGKYGSLDLVLDLANRLFAELEKAETGSRLPEKVDKARISTVVSRTYLSFWNRSGVGHS